MTASGKNHHVENSEVAEEIIEGTQQRHQQQPKQEKCKSTGFGLKLFAGMIVNATCGRSEPVIAGHISPVDAPQVRDRVAAVRGEGRARAEG